MIGKDEIKSIIKYLELPDRNYMVVMGGSMCMYDIRATEDLDIWVDQYTFDRLSRRFYQKPTIVDSGDCKISIDMPLCKVEIFEKINLKELLFDAIEVEDVMCQQLESVRKMKLNLDRQKDHRDLELLEDYLHPETICQDLLNVTFVGKGDRKLYTITLNYRMCEIDTLYLPSGNASKYNIYYSTLFDEINTYIPEDVGEFRLIDAPPNSPKYTRDEFIDIVADNLDNCTFSIE